MNKEAFELIGQNKLYEAITLLKTQLTRRRDLNTLTTLEARLNHVTAQVHRGLLAESEASIELNKIRNALIELLSPSEPAVAGGRNRPLIFGITGVGAVLVAIMAFFVLRDEKPAPVVCDDHNVAVLVADFQDKEKPNARDQFALSIVSDAEKLLGGVDYDIASIGREDRGKNYHDAMRVKHFERATTCDTSGVLLNGLLDVDNDIFVVWITLANLGMRVPELANKSSLVLDNPVSVEFSMPEDAEFLAQFIYGILKSAEGKPLESLEKFFELEKENPEMLKENPDLKANLAFFKGNAYAQRGDEERANAQYDLATESDNPDLRQAAENNKTTAKRMNLEMLRDDDTRAIVKANKRQHSTFEKELEKMFRDIGRGIDGAVRGIFGQ